MPIYEFKCLKCNEIFEILAVKSEDSVEVKCPQCSGEEVERVVSRVSFSVAGSDSGYKPSVTNRECTDGSCHTITLPGHTK